MDIIKTKRYTLIKPIKNTFSNLIKELSLNEKSLKNNHLIIDISEKFNTDFVNLDVFLPLSRQHKQNGTSFVIVFNANFDDDLLDEMDIVPTLKEAEDIVEMDAISKDLGF